MYADSADACSTPTGLLKKCLCDALSRAFSITGANELYVRWVF